MRDYLIDRISSIFNCNIDYEKLDFIYQSYADLGDNPNIRVLNYPFVKGLVDKQCRRVEDFGELVDECLSEGCSCRYGLVCTSEGFFVLELGLRVFGSSDELREFYKE